MRKNSIERRNGRRINTVSTVNLRLIGMTLSAFLLGSILTALIILNIQLHDSGTAAASTTSAAAIASSAQSSSSVICSDRRIVEDGDGSSSSVSSSSSSSSSVASILNGLKILVVIASYDFSQIPHLEEVISAYHDVCAAGALVDVIVHTTVPYPVPLVDMWNTRITCDRFHLNIVLKPASVRLFLVDDHRRVFYDRLRDESDNKSDDDGDDNVHRKYDLFVYTEDDIRVTPTTIATYMAETRRVQSVLGNVKGHYKPSDFNVGIVRYEYNYPSNVIIDDNTRHATQNVTRVRIGVVLMHSSPGFRIA
jgi:hypothetical protein